LQKYAKKICKKKGGGEAGMEETNKRNEAKKSPHKNSRMKAGFQPKTSACKDRENNLNGNDRLIMERWKQYFL
jgi:hypothetical protein